MAKISDAYTERKVNFAKDIQLVLQKSESAAQVRQAGMVPTAYGLSPCKRQGNVWFQLNRFSLQDTRPRQCLQKGRNYMLHFLDTDSLSVS